ncbi:MAG: hypothetical protein IJ228_10405, partial [Succinivibrio sp.]|nr:hypothetical protein [Succinivibrio sp.]
LRRFPMTIPSTVVTEDNGHSVTELERIVTNYNRKSGLFVTKRIKRPQLIGGRSSVERSDLGLRMGEWAIVNGFLVHEG